MCGLAGFARHPKADGIKICRKVFESLLLGNEARGKHATGFGVVNADGKRDIFKIAVPATTLIASDRWREESQRISSRSVIVLGHTRYATHANAHEDSAAHPFIEGKIMGAHNGIVANWTQLAKDFGKAYAVDSEVIFGALNREKNVNKALDQLDGYWALTWTRGTMLHICKTNDVPLALAYVPALRALFWSSEKRVLSAALSSHGIENFEMWEANSNTLYQFDPTHFSTQGTGVIKSDLTFRGRARRDASKFDSSRPSLDNGWRDRSIKGGSVKHAPTWDSVAGRERVPDTPRSQSISLLDLYRKLDALEGMVRTLAGKLETAEAEYDYLFSILDESGLLKGDAAEPMIDQRQTSLPL